jgi:hypothetical protein
MEVTLMVSKWRKKEDYVRKALTKKFGIEFKEMKVPLRGLDKGYKFDLVSVDGSIVGEIKTYTYSLPSGSRPSAKIAHASEACLFLMHAQGAKRKLLVFTDREFYNKFKRERQGRMAEYNGIEIILVEC